MDKKIATLVLPIRDGKVLLGLKVRKGADIGEQTVNGPGGKLDPGQTLESCAIAETQEETGITDCEFVDGFTREMTYMFRGRRGGLIRKTVVFFLGHTRESSVTLSHEHVGFAWVTPDEALKKLTYPNAKAMLNAALDHLKQTH